MKSGNRINVFLAIVFFSFINSSIWADEYELVWSTFLGGSDQDYVYDIEVDKYGGVYVAGHTRSLDFPNTWGIVCDTVGNDWNIVVLKLNIAEHVLEYSVLLGGSDSDMTEGIAIDSNGNAYVTGYTLSTDFPVTLSAYDRSQNSNFQIKHDAFVVKFNQKADSLIYSTYLGGQDTDLAYGIDIDNNNCAYIIGSTYSSDYPTTSGAFDTSSNDISENCYDTFVTKLNPEGSSLVYSTFLGGGSSDWGIDIIIDDSNHAYLTGSTNSTDFPATPGAFDTTFYWGNEIFLTKLSSDGDSLKYSTALGGDQDDYGYSLALDSQGNVYITGSTLSPDFPITQNAYDDSYNGGNEYILMGDIFVAKINSRGSDLLHSTYIGGSMGDAATSITIDKEGYLYTAGITYSADFPTTESASDRTLGGTLDAFWAILNPSGDSLIYSTFLGGNRTGWAIEGANIALTDEGSIILAGTTDSDDFPTTIDAFDRTLNDTSYYGGDAFITKVSVVETIIRNGPSLMNFPTYCCLISNHPNPFNANTEIRYRIPKHNHVLLKIYNNLGQEVRKLVDKKQLDGDYAIVWDGKNKDREDVASGTYFCCLETGVYTKTVKMSLLR